MADALAMNDFGRGKSPAMSQAAREKAATLVGMASLGSMLGTLMRCGHDINYNHAFSWGKALAFAAGITVAVSGDAAFRAVSGNLQANKALRGISSSEMKTILAATGHAATFARAVGDDWFVRTPDATGFKTLSREEFAAHEKVMADQGREVVKVEEEGTSIVMRRYVGGKLDGNDAAKPASLLFKEDGDVIRQYAKGGELIGNPARLRTDELDAPRIGSAIGALARGLFASKGAEIASAFMGGVAVGYAGSGGDPLLVVGAALGVATASGVYLTAGNGKEDDYFDRILAAVATSPGLTEMVRASETVALKTTDGWIVAGPSSKDGIREQHFCGPDEFAKLEAKIAEGSGDLVSIRGADNATFVTRKVGGKLDGIDENRPAIWSVGPDGEGKSYFVAGEHVTNKGSAEERDTVGRSAA
jgi:hypothetical protein